MKRAVGVAYAEGVGEDSRDDLTPQRNMQDDVQMQDEVWLQWHSSRWSVVATNNGSQSPCAMS
jgi:hypothetical protein